MLRMITDSRKLNLITIVVKSDQCSILEARTSRTEAANHDSTFNARIAANG